MTINKTFSQSVQNSLRENVAFWQSYDHDDIDYGNDTEDDEDDNKDDEDKDDEDDNVDEKDEDDGTDVVVGVVVHDVVVDDTDVVVGGRGAPYSGGNLGYNYLSVPRQRTMMIITKIWRIVAVVIIIHY